MLRFEGGKRLGSSGLTPNHVTTGSYPLAFYAGARDNATVILPLAFGLTGIPRSLVDVGGGLGAWAAAAKTLGVEKVALVDGPWLRLEDLEVQVEEFFPVNLETQALAKLGSYEMVICLEVAEHLSPARGPSFVAELCNLSDSILFSAATPGQGGTHHVNERLLSYWQRLFADQGFVLEDPVRAEIWNDDRVEWWCAQNTVLFRRSDNVVYAGLVDVVHPKLFRKVVRFSLLPLVRKLPGGLRIALRSLASFGKNRASR